MLSTSVDVLASGARLRFARLGPRSADVAPIVLLHGYPDNLQIFGEVAPRLAEAFDVIAIDWPGMGESDAWKGGATPAIMADRLAAILDHLGVARAFVVGLDMGGQPALVFAATHPTRTAGVVVMNSLVMGDEPTSWEIDLLRKFGFNRLVIGHLPRIVFRRAEKTFLPPGVRLPAEVRADLWRSFARPAARAFVVRMCAGYQATLSKLPGYYARIVAPSLILWGECDHHFPVRHAERLHEIVGGSELAVIQGGEHWMVWDRAEEVASRILAFVRAGCEVNGRQFAAGG